jgi:hypothetical protein
MYQIILFNMSNPTTGYKKKEVKGFWVRGGKEGFLISKVYMNKNNAKIVAAGSNLDRRVISRNYYKVVPVIISYKE